MKVIETIVDNEESHVRHSSSSSEYTDVCAICLDRVHMGCRLTGTCIHRFCFECFFNWSKRQNLCPLCQRTYLRFDCRIFSETQLNRFERILIGSNRLINPNNFALRKLLKNPKWRGLDHFWHRLHGISFVDDSKIIILLLIDANEERNALLFEDRVKQIYDHVYGNTEEEEPFRQIVDSLLKHSQNNIHLMTLIVSDRRLRHFRKI